ncbi:hypothetical protein JCM10213_006509 [Rhodosporidiobolus nylandii]
MPLSTAHAASISSQQGPFTLAQLFAALPNLFHLDSADESVERASLSSLPPGLKLEVVEEVKRTASRRTLSTSLRLVSKVFRELCMAWQTAQLAHHSSQAILPCYGLEFPRLVIVLEDWRRPHLHHQI